MRQTRFAKRSLRKSPHPTPRHRAIREAIPTGIALALALLGGLAMPLKGLATRLDATHLDARPGAEPSTRQAPELAQRILIRRRGDRPDHDERAPYDWRDNADWRDDYRHDSRSNPYGNRLPRCYPGYDCHPRYDYRPRRRPEPPNPLPLVSTQDCTDLTVMARLSYMWDAGSSLSDAVTGAQLAVCSSGGVATSLSRWGNGQVARFGNGWNYPNGVAGRFGSSWQYPNGQLLMSGSSWFYPNGRSARFGANWFTPSGRPVSQQELLSLACGQLGTRQCGDRLQQVPASSGFWYDLTVVELAWLSGR
ncbi:hypothetical protein HPC62_02720 [Thermoleptolyngbya sichuanensis A183]|uniref:Uncharacterized protein n=1 Tax=Thermoleptolyngbya sichuanensis A183 TaxID=2737172 RepID=A0A6M8B2F3_9CYAN|nr:MULTISPECIES: hypothetical protein [Thermoleptolyngbya]QKD81229.1 hypothetical protein HPC62_02720 [Thermoleptolyngbya sichuanensis A183]